MKRVALVCALLALALLGSVDAASACYSQCLRVDPDTACRRCIYRGYYTGISCENVGDCGCAIVQSSCRPSFQAEARTEPAEAGVCQALPFAETLAAAD